MAIASHGIFASSPTTETEEVLARVLYGLMLPTVRLARLFRVPSKQLGALVEMAHFHEMRGAGMRLAEVGSVLDISLRKAAQLSKQLKYNFLEPEREVGLPRRIEYLLWAQDLSKARMLQLLKVPPQEVAAALKTLLQQQRIRNVGSKDEPVYHRESQHSRLVSAEWQGRLDALSNLMGHLCATVYARFFRNDAKAFARTVNFRLRAEDLPELQALYEHCWKTITELEARAKQDPNALDMDFSLLWAADQNLEGEVHAKP